MARAVRVNGHRKEEGGAEQVGDLQANVILAVPIGRHFEDAISGRPRGEISE